MTHVLFAAMTLVALSPGVKAGAAEVRLLVDPMPEPKPALKFQLLPEVRELNTGNAAQEYLKCFMEQKFFFFSKQATTERTRYQSMTLAEISAAKIRGYGGNALRQADRAARMEGIDWQSGPLVQAGHLEETPAELGPLEVLALALNVRLRAEVSDHHYEDAVGTAKTMFALGRHLGEYPSGLANRVGLWVAQLALGSLEEMVQQPGCPNLYWALTDLPCPLVDLRKGAQGDRAQAAAHLRPIRGDAPMTDAEIEACVGPLSGVLGFAREQTGHAPRSLRTRLAARANDPEQLEGARQRLAELGTAADLVSKLPSSQQILLDEKLAFEIKRDARIRLLVVPLWRMDSMTGHDGSSPSGDGLFDDLLPTVVELRRAQGALEQEIALLRHVEALRLHAAGHSGHLPTALSEVGVPLPNDPFTGQPFEYEAEGTTAHLRGRSARTDEADQGSRAHFEVTLRH